MNRLKYIVIAFSLILASCTDLNLILPGIFEDDCIVMTVSNSTMTKADDDGLAYERRLDTLYFFFYPKGQTDSPCVFYHKEAMGENTVGKVDVKIYVAEDAIRKIFPTNDECDVFVIANLPKYLIPKDPNVFKDDSPYTSMDQLQKYILKLDDKEDDEYFPEHDGIEKPFVMAGLGIAEKNSKKNAIGSVALRRAAAKITISVAIPEYLENVPIVVDGQDATVTMAPALEDNLTVSTMNTAFHNGTYKGYLFSDVDEAVDTFYLASSKKTFKYANKTLQAIKYKNPEKSHLDSIPARKVYTCEVPFYTYAREWEKGAADAAYMTFEMKWGVKEDGSGTLRNVKTYYYQILINAAERSFEPNHWYDMFVNVGVIGSTVKLEPIIIDHLAFFVLDWFDEYSGIDHPDEDVVLSTYTYLNLDTPYLELDNVPVGYIRYDASHSLEYEIKEVYYYDNSGVNEVKTTYGDSDNIKITKQGNSTLLYSYNMPKEQYAPVITELDIWLNLDGIDGYDASKESEFLKHVQIVHYPPMYVQRDQSTLRSVYVDGKRSTAGSLSGVNLGNNSNFPLGYNQGVRNFQNGNDKINYSMFIINVTSFDEDDVFYAPELDANGCLKVNTGNQGSFPTQPTIIPYKYIIGDPRARDIDITLDGGDVVAGLWASGDALYPVDTQRSLTYYYPTESFGNSFQIVAPKFRIVSFNNASGKQCNAKSAAMRCASVQEDGFPAGRWRLPTVAEIQYIIKLQRAGAIQEVFSTTNNDPSCYATASYGNTAKDRRITMSLIDDNDDNDENDVRWNNIQTKISVRCVYDDWYWGSGRDAKLNNNSDGVDDTGDEYLFTWGDKPIVW